MFGRNLKRCLDKNCQKPRAHSLANLRRPLRAEQLEIRRLLAGDLGSIPILNSNPSAPASIYLDFNGHFEAGWNETYPAFDRDGDPTTMNEEERTFILEVWTVAAEDFAPFNINVTTVEPAALAPGVPIDAANGIALRVAIGGSAADFGRSDDIAGMAYYSSFTNSFRNIAWVFPETNAGGHRLATSIGTIASHEAGHSFGLRHKTDTVDVVAKTQGIMASGLIFEYATWSLGPDEYGNHQDDMAVLSSSTNGFGYRPDDLGGSISNASPLVYNNGTLTGSGIIGSTTDVDMFSLFTPGANGVKIDVQGIGIGQNLDVVFDFLDASGNVIATANPGDSLDGTLIVPSVGASYLAVRSSGSYGRIGQYTVSVSEALPSVEVIAAAAGLKTSEQGSSDSFTVRLTSKPAADVTITVSSSDQSEGMVDPGLLVFTAENWHLPQPIVVTGVDDIIVDGISNFSINFANVLSVDSNYNGMSIASIQATNADNDVPGSAVQMPGTYEEIKIDHEGNLIVTGRFSGTQDFDPSEGATLLTANATYDGYVAKYSPTYELIWVKSFGGNSSTYSNSFDVDNSGNVYVAGYTLADSIAFGGTVLTTRGLTDAFLAKLDSSGNFLWAHTWGSSELDQAERVRVGANGNVIVAGYYNGTIDANPGSGTFTLASLGSADGYVSQFTSNGTFITSTSVGGPELDFIRQLEIDLEGNIYVGGPFGGSAQFGSHALTSAGGSDQFLMKMNPGGSVQWVRQVAGDGTAGSPTGLAIDENGSAILTSAFTGYINFGQGTPTLTAVANRSSYVAKWDSSGTFQRADQFSGDDRVSILGLTIGVEGNLYLFGYLQGTADFDPGPGEAIRTSSGLQDSFILRLDSNYQFIDEVQIARSSGNIASLAVDYRGNVIAAGGFSSSGTVTLPTGDVFDASNGAGNAYLMRWTLAAGITPTPTVGLVTAEDGASTSFNVVLDTPPTADVTIPVSSSDPDEGVVSTSSLTFTPVNWNVPQTVVVTGVDDAAIDGDKTYSIVLGPASSADPAYDGLDANYVSVTNSDNDQPLVLFNDSFEVSEWNGLWVEDSQNDWFRSSQRSTDGSRSAEVDGSANNATLTTASAIDLGGMQSATLTFDWLIESGFDSGEYLALDVSTNGGASWIQDVRRLNGNIDAENTWHSETVDLTPYSSSNLKIRFRSKVSASDEDANVDNVRITAIPAGPNVNPTAVIGGPYALNEGGSVTLSGAASSDSDGTIVSYAWDLDNDGQYDDAVGATASFSTTVSSVHTVGLMVTDNRGGTHVTSTSVAVNNVAPTATAGSDQSGSVGASISLSAAASSDPGNDITGYAWDLDNDGQFDDAFGVTAAFTSSVAGAFTVRVQVTDADGASSVDAVVITLSNSVTKFYVINDASTDRTYEYDPSGNAIENYAINSGNTSPRGAASTAAGTTVWVADRNRKVYVYDTAGGLQGSWSAGTLASNALVEGLATNGTDVWIVDSKSDKVYRYTNAAGRLSGSQSASSSFSLNSSNRNPKGIVTDGAFLWIVNSSTTDKVFKYTTSGSLVGSWSIDSANRSPTGLTIDPANGSQSIWIVDSGTDRVYEYAGARSRTSGNQAADGTFDLASGNSNPQGIADPPPPTTSRIISRATDEFHATAVPIQPSRLDFSLDDTTLLRLNQESTPSRLQGLIGIHPLNAHAVRKSSADADFTSWWSSAPSPHDVDQWFALDDESLEELGADLLASLAQPGIGNS